MLSSLGILDQVSKPGDRKDYYQLAEYPFRSLLGGYLKRMEHMERIVREADMAIAESMPDAHKRLAGMAHFYLVARESTRELIERLEQVT
jgi:hypothetical protein